PSPLPRRSRRLLAGEFHVVATWPALRVNRMLRESTHASHRASTISPNAPVGEKKPCSVKTAVPAISHAGVNAQPPHVNHRGNNPVLSDTNDAPPAKAASGKAVNAPTNACTSYSARITA